MIDLRSDTVTRPDERMREAMRDASVGDDKRDGDPTVEELEAETADRLGTDAAVFVPSGTMGNQIAIRAQTEPGQEIVLDRYAHVYTSEFAGSARFSQLQVRTVRAGPDGCPSPDAVRDAYQERSQWPGFGLLSLENTHNKRGGVAAEPGDIDAAAEAAHELDMSVHLDGARLANAAVALDQPLDAFTDHVDTVMFDLSKGLGAPVGAVLAGEAAIVDEARNYRNAFGGGMRQAGCMAAAGLVALNNVERLATDHANATAFAERLDDGTRIEVQHPDTNIVLVDVAPLGLTGEEFLERCSAAGVGGGSVRGSTVRFCTHLDVDRSDVETAADRIRDLLDRRD